MMSKLPIGWASARLEELVDFNPKQSFDDELSAGFVPMSHAPTNFLDKLRFDDRPWGEIKKAYTNFKDGDVIFAKVTPCFENGKAALVENLPNGIGAGSSEFYVIRPACEGVSAKFLLALVKSREFLLEGASNMTGAVGLRRVPKKFVESYITPVPPAAEQIRIAQKLDELLAQVCTLKSRIDTLPARLKRFRQSILAAAVSGRLTEEWRASQEQEFKWAETSIGCVCESSFYGPRFGKGDYVANGLPTIRTTDMTPRGEILITSTTPRVNVPKEKIEHLKIHSGDLLITRTGSIGTMAIFRGNYEAIPSAYLIRFRFKETASVSFIHTYLTSPLGQEKLGLGITTTTQPNINAQTIRGIKLKLPSVAEQTEIVRRVEQLFAFADQLEAKVGAAKTHIDHLTQSILAKAFRGELMPQDPDDEPASVLLERIKAQRASAPKAKRSSKSPAT